MPSKIISNSKIHRNVPNSERETVHMSESQINSTNTGNVNGDIHTASDDLFDEFLNVSDTHPSVLSSSHWSECYTAAAMASTPSSPSASSSSSAHPLFHHNKLQQNGNIISSSKNIKVTTNKLNKDFEVHSKNSFSSNKSNANHIILNVDLSDNENENENDLHGDDDNDPRQVPSSSPTIPVDSPSMHGESLEIREGNLTTKCFPINTSPLTNVNTNTNTNTNTNNGFLRAPPTFKDSISAYPNTNSSKSKITPASTSTSTTTPPTATPGLKLTFLSTVQYASAERAKILLHINQALTIYASLLVDTSTQLLVEPRSDFLVTYLKGKGFDLKTKNVNDIIAEVRNNRVDPEILKHMPQPNAFLSNFKDSLIETNKRRKVYNKRKTTFTKPEKYETSWSDGVGLISSDPTSATSLTFKNSISNTSITSLSTHVPIAPAPTLTPASVSTPAFSSTSTSTPAQAQLQAQAWSQAPIPHTNTHSHALASRDGKSKHLSNSVSPKFIQMVTTTSTSMPTQQPTPINGSNMVSILPKPRGREQQSFLQSPSLQQHQHHGSFTTFPTRHFSDTSIVQNRQRLQQPRDLLPIKAKLNPTTRERVSDSTPMTNVNVKVVKIGTIVNKNKQSRNSGTLIPLTDLRNIDKINEEGKYIAKLKSANTHLGNCIDEIYHGTFSHSLTYTKIPLTLNPSTNVNLEKDQMVSFVELTIDLADFITDGKSTLKNVNYASIIQLKSIIRIYDGINLIYRRCDPVNGSFLKENSTLVKIILPLQAKLWAGMINDYHNGAIEDSQFENLVITHSIFPNDNIVNFKSQDPLHSFIWDFTTNDMESTPRSINIVKLSKPAIAQNLRKSTTLKLGNVAPSSSSSSKRVISQTVPTSTSTSKPKSKSNSKESTPHLSQQPQLQSQPSHQPPSLHNFVLTPGFTPNTATGTNSFTSARTSTSTSTSTGMGTTTGRGHKRTRSRSLNELDLLSFPTSLSLDEFIRAPETILETITPSDTTSTVSPVMMTQPSTSSSVMKKPPPLTFDTVFELKHYNHSDSQLHLHSQNMDSLGFDESAFNSFSFDLADIESEQLAADLGISGVSPTSLSEGVAPLRRH
jgi:hypothetical protein